MSLQALLYSSIRNHFCLVRSLYTTTSLQKQSVSPEDKALKKYMRQQNLSSEQVHDLIQDTDQLDDGMDEVTPVKSQHLQDSMQGISNQEGNVWKKIIKKKYFSDLYMIKPGEIYSKNKDPFFKRGNKKSSDYYHKHHQTNKHFSSDQSVTKEVDSNEINSPLNIFSRVYDLYQEESIKQTSSTKYAKTIPSYPSPNESYTCSNIGMSRGKFQSKSLMNDLDDCDSQASRFDAFETSDKPSSESFSDYTGPCLLLWSMKEQMRYLHDADPDRWDSHALSLVFPISQVNAQKILKSRWRPLTEADVTTHDLRVVEHWHSLSGGQITSTALINKIISNRSTGVDGTTSVPALSANTEEMMDFLDTLVFDEPDSAVTLGVSRGEAPKVQRKPTFGYFIDILKNYESQVQSLKKNSFGEGDPDETSEITQLDEVILKMPTYNDEEMIKISCPSVAGQPGAASLGPVKRTYSLGSQAGRQSATTRGRYLSREPVVTYEQFLEKKKRPDQGDQPDAVSDAAPIRKQQQQQRQQFRRNNNSIVKKRYF